jgi:DNA-binding transcriptional MocR family regulator
MRPNRVNASQQILQTLELEIADLSPGARVSSVRALAARHGASPVTVQQALSQLARAGKIHARPGHGTFKAPAATPPAPRDLSWQSATLGDRARVRVDLHALLAPPASGLIPLSSGYTDETVQPLIALERAATRALKRPGVWNRAPRDGVEALRAWFAAQVGGDTRASDVLIAPGGQAAVAGTLRALVPLGGAVVVESPTYFGAIAACDAAGLRAVPIPVDEHGIRPSDLERAFTEHGARVAYLQPLFQNPTGVTLSVERRTQILEVCARFDAFVIEDDYARDFALEGAALPPLHTLDPGRVVYLRSLTKAAAPSLRIACTVARGAALERLRVMRGVDDLFVAQSLQEIALELVTGSAWTRHLDALRRTLRERRDAALEALGTHLPSARVRAPAGGIGLWVQIPGDDLGFVAAAARVGVQLHAGRAWFPAEPTGSYVRISFAGATQAQLLEGIERLGQAHGALTSSKTG